MPRTAKSSTAKPKMALNLLNDYHLFSFDILDSTNEEAKRQAHHGGTHGAVIWAKQQLQGRGRQGREWISDAGNLFVSVLLQPQCALSDATQLSYVSGLAVYDCVRGVMPPDADVTLKWPNDVLIQGKKVSGILLESFRHPDIEDQMWVIAGVGVNVEHMPPAGSVQFPATSLKNAGVELISAKIVLSRFIHHFIERYNAWQTKGFAHVRKDWNEAAWKMEQEITVNIPGETVVGTNKGLDAEGNLVVQTAKGKRVINVGDVN